MTNEISLGSLSNNEIIAEVVRLAGVERRATAQLIEALAGKKVTVAHAGVEQAEEQVAWLLHEWESLSEALAAHE